MRIEIGYGLESILPDGLAGEIIRKEFTPAFKQGNYAQGVRNGIRRIAEIISDNKQVSAEEIRRLNSQREILNQFPPVLMVLFFSLFVTIGFFMLGIGFGSRVGFFVLFGSLFGVMPMAMSLLFTPLAKIVLPPLGLAMLLFGFWKGRSKPAAFRGNLSKGKTSGGWTMMGGRGSVSGSSSGSTSGGNDFGGGMSGGGGASGDW